MKKKSIVGMLVIAGAISIGATTHNVEQNSVKNHVLLVDNSGHTKEVKGSKIDTSSKEHNKIDKTKDSANQNLTKEQVSELATKTIKKHGMVFKGIKAMKIAPRMTNSFLATPGFNQDGFASSVNESLYNYELNLKNDQKSMGEAITLHGGNPVDTCVFFQSSSLRAIGQAVPDSIGYTTHLENWLANNGWSRHTNFEYIQKGDLCFASYYHTFLFMGWKDKAQGVAWVMGNESFVQPYYRKRNLNGQSPQIYGDNSYTGATCFWTYGKGYQGPQTVSNPLHTNEYNAFGTTKVTSKTPLYQNQGSGTVFSEIPANTNLPILKSDNGWYQVFYNEHLGWVNSNNTTGIAESMGGGSGTANTETGSNLGGPYKNIQSTKEPSIGVGVITANGGLWLNSAPSVNSTQIELLPKGANVSVVAQQGHWNKIQYYGQIGWVDANYMQSMMSPSTPSPAADAPASSKVPAPHTEVSNGTTTVTADILLNNKPEATYNGATALATIPDGTSVKVIGKTSNNWYKVIYNGVTGYISAAYTNGFVAAPVHTAGWKLINGSWYYENSNGTKDTGWNEINDAWYYMNSNGVMQTGWTTVNGSDYYFNQSGAMETGWQKIDGNWYNLSVSGAKNTGWFETDGKWYFLNSKGVMQTGWQDINNGWYYLNESGVMQKGWFKLDGKWYFTNASGKLVTPATPNSNAITNLDGTAVVNTSIYLNNEPESTYDGATALATINSGTTVKVIGKTSNGWFKVQYNGMTGYIGSSYTNGYVAKKAITTGWHIVNGAWHYYNNDGVVQTGWQKIDGSWYYLDSQGAMETGWFELGDSWYYFAGNGSMQTGVQEINNNSYLFADSGAMQTGWQMVNEAWHYFDASGAMQTGWTEVDGSWYYLDSQGAMETGWYELGNTWYYFAGNGSMQTGWQKISGKWYFFETSGALRN